MSIILLSVNVPTYAFLERGSSTVPGFSGEPDPFPTFTSTEGIVQRKPESLAFLRPHMSPATEGSQVKEVS